MKKYSLNSFCFLTLLVSVSLISCKENSSSSSTIGNLFNSTSFDTEKFTQELKNSIKDTTIVYYFGDSILLQNEINSAYEVNNFNSLWLGSAGLNDNFNKFKAEIDQLRFDGLSIKDFYLDSLDILNKTFKTQDEDVNLAVDLDKKASYVFFKACNQLLKGKIKSDKINKDWINTNDSILDVKNIITQLNEGKKFNEIFETLRPQTIEYKKLRAQYIKLDSFKNADFANMAFSINDVSIPEKNTLVRKKLNAFTGEPTNLEATTNDIDFIHAIKKLQYINNIEQTGSLDEATLEVLNAPIEAQMKKIAMNMERWRWLKINLSEEYILVNIPKLELDYYEKDSNKWNMNVVVGRTSRKTPLLDAKMKDIVFCPPWYVPPTILKEEVLPGISRRGGSYLRRRGLQATDSRGRVVDASRINASNYKRFSINQKPGLNSALGTVKFNFPNKLSIYLHDTNHRGDFEKKYRAFSSGCIRVHKPREFAEFLLRDTNYTKPKIDSLVKRNQTKFMPMDKRNIFLHIMYQTVALDSAGNIKHYPDIYKWDEELVKYF